jgi:hypothetical protein
MGNILNSPSKPGKETRQRPQAGSKTDERSGEVAVSKKRHNFYKHGGYGTRLYNIWRLIRQRVNSPKCKDYPHYGARGIRMCDEWWNGYHAFESWAISYGYNDTLTVDRIDVDGNYSPENCRLATRRQQCQNKRNTRMVNVEGESVRLAELAQRNGIYKETLAKRLKLGWKVDKAVSEPVHKK